MPKKVTVITGPIVGLNSEQFLSETNKFAKAAGEEIVIFNLFDEIIKLEGIEAENDYEKIIYIGQLLDGYTYQFKCLREKAYLSIANRISKLSKNVCVAIRTPASIEWRGYNVVLKDHMIISEAINPDAIVTLIDAEWKIKKRLQTNYGQRALRIIAHQKELTIPKILEWLASEVTISEDWAEWASHLSGNRVNHVVIGIETPSLLDRNKYLLDVDNLVKLLTQNQVPTFYASYSMTVAQDEVRKKINSIIWKLRAYGVVVDPASIELGCNVEPEHESTVFAYTVCRDLRWDVQKVDSVVALHPYKEAPPLSTGMMDELGHAKAFGKDRYFLLPSGAGSPFTADNYVPANHLFTSEKELFNFFEKKRRPVLKPKYQQFQALFRKLQ